MNYLHGKNIMLTRTAEQNRTTSALLAAAGANSILFPCLEIRYLNPSIQTGLRQLPQTNRGSTDIIFSSSNGVKAVAASVDSLADTLAGFSIVAVGHKTAQALKDFGCPVNHLPVESSQQGLVNLYNDRARQKNMPCQVFFFRAEEGSATLEHHLDTQGVPHHLIHAYSSQCDQSRQPEIIKQLEQGHIDAVLLGSAKTAAFYLQKIHDLTLANRPVIAVMSPQVAQAADKLGLKVQVIADKPGFRTMLEGLNHYFAKQQGR